jgi:hypothetical protein
MLLDDIYHPDVEGKEAIVLDSGKSRNKVDSSVLPRRHRSTRIRKARKERP